MLIFHKTAGLTEVRVTIGVKSHLVGTIKQAGHRVFVIRVGQYRAESSSHSSAKSKAGEMCSRLIIGSLANHRVFHDKE